jgi:hypothetical protein
MGQRCSGERVNCFALWAAGKHQFFTTGARVSENLTRIHLFFIGIVSI